jgi:lipid-A-disaccharide synthase
LAMAGLPAVVAYRTNPLTGWLLRKVVKVPFVNLVNVLVEREAVPELLLERCTADALDSAVQSLLTDAVALAAQKAAYREALERLGRGGERPSLRAADVVLRLVRERGE